MLPYFLNPKTVFTTLDAIDREYPSHSADRHTGSKQALVVLFSASLCLLLLYIGKAGHTMDAVTPWLNNVLSGTVFTHLDQSNDGGSTGLIRYFWWSFCHVVTFALLPSLVIKFILKDSLIRCGWGWGETHRHWQGYLLLLSPIIVFAILASYTEEFSSYYPFYKMAGRSWMDFIVWESLYLTQFAVLEFFFRGFMLNTLRPHYGSASIWIMVVPYMMVHLDKPWLEALGSILFGLFLGMLALRSRSIWGGFFVHAGVALGMDLASLTQKGAIPQTLWPAL